MNYGDRGGRKGLLGYCFLQDRKRVGKTLVLILKRVDQRIGFVIIQGLELLLHSERVARGIVNSDCCKLGTPYFGFLRESARVV